jgi:hypothetical protein
VHTEFWWESLEVKNIWGYRDLDGRMKLILTEAGNEVVDRILPVQDKMQWLPLFKTAMNFSVPVKRMESLDQLSDCHISQ